MTFLSQCRMSRPSDPQTSYAVLSYVKLKVIQYLVLCLPPSLLLICIVLLFDRNVIHQ